jgi:hypothetical protein
VVTILVFVFYDVELYGFLPFRLILCDFVCFCVRVQMAEFNRSHGVGEERVNTGAYINRQGRHTGPTLLTGE